MLIPGCGHAGHSTIKLLRGNSRAGRTPALRHCWMYVYCRIVVLNSRYRSCDASVRKFPGQNERAYLGVAGGGIIGHVFQMIDEVVHARLGDMAEIVVGF